MKKTLFSPFLAVVGLFLALLLAGCEKEPIVPVEEEKNLTVEFPASIELGATTVIKITVVGYDSTTSNLPGAKLIIGSCINKEVEISALTADTMRYTFKSYIKGSVAKTFDVKIAVAYEIPFIAQININPNVITEGDTISVDWYTTPTAADSAVVYLYTTVDSTLLSKEKEGAMKITPTVVGKGWVKIIAYGKDGVIKTESQMFRVKVRPPLTREEILCLGSRKKIQEDIFLEGQRIFSLDTTVLCEQDDRQTFYLDYTAKNDFGEVLCDGETEHSISWKGWRLSGDTLWGMGEPRLIKILSPDTLRWEWKSHYQSQDGTVLPTKVVQVFVRRN